jgi:microtubule-associated protein-like 6
VTALCSGDLNGTPIIISGGKNGCLRVWDVSDTSCVTLLIEMDLTAKGLFGGEDPTGLHLNARAIHSVSHCVKNGQPTILVGTRGCDMFELAFDVADVSKASIVNQAFLQQGHCDNELWGLATHPTLPEFCTVGDDRYLRIFDIHTRKVTSSPIPSFKPSLTLTPNPNPNPHTHAYSHPYGRC